MLKTPITKTEFVTNSGVAVKPPKIKLQKLSDPTGRYIKILLFGDYGSGKTFALVSYLLQGLKVLVIGCDIGGDGLGSVTAELNKLGRPELKENLVFITLPTHEDVRDFFRDPNAFWDASLGADTIWDFGFDMVFFDGFTGYQQIQLAEYIEFSDTSVRNKDESLDTMRFWGAVRRETGRTLNNFLSLHNRKTGQLWHKVMTCLDSASVTEAQALDIAGTSDDKDRQRKQKIKEAVGPMIQGSASKLIGPAFDLVIYTNAKTITNKDGKPEQQFTYRTMKSEKMKVKARGVDLSSLLLDEKKAVLRADMGAVWSLAVQQLDIPVKNSVAPVTETEAA